MKMKLFLRSAAVLLVLLAFGRGLGSGQHTNLPGLGSSTPFPGTPSNPSTAAQDPAARTIDSRQVRLRNDERQRRLLSDSEKLLELATSLHNDVAKTNKDILSLDVIRRAEEIEKLARGVKERMRG